MFKATKHNEHSLSVFVDENNKYVDYAVLLDE